MKLPDFSKFPPLMAIKRSMGIPEDACGNINIAIDASRLTEFELEKLASSSGLDISIDDVEIQQDGTLSYKNSRVILYIRDVPNSLIPKFHIANCSKLQSMRNDNKIERYVISTRHDGKFLVNYEMSSAKRSEMCELLVCKNCMDMLAFDGYSVKMKPAIKDELVAQFSLSRFFEKYPKSLHIGGIKFNSDNAPENVYSSDFEIISQTIRRAANWKCKACGVNLSRLSNRKWLHVHHKNGIKYDNRSENLIPLCIGCHAEQKSHEHIKETIDYQQFQMARPGLSSSASD